MEILADVVINPRFDATELRKLKTRELDRLTLQLQDANFLATREMHKALYGSHPYANIDTTADVVNRVARADLQRWHRSYVVPNNAVLIAVGAVPPARVQAAADRLFANWRRADVAAAQYPEPPAITARRVILVDRQESVQSVIAIGNLAMARNNPDYVPLMVANQVLGGSAASRLFMDLRERRSLTYGAYSRLVESVQIAPFRARAQVRNEVTGQAMEAFMEHLERITTEAPPQEELHNAHNYLSDSFPLLIDTPGKVANLVADLRVYGLPDDYWETYRGAIREVDAQEALTAAREYIHPDRSVVVVVGRASEVLEPLRRWGPVSVVNVQGQPVDTVTAPAATPVNPPAAEGNRPASVRTGG
jgi:predicted Zn-dependent peptidase